MPINVQQRLSGIVSQGPKPVPTYEEKMSWSMRWFALIILSTGYIVSIITGIIGFAASRDPHFLVFVSPTLFTPAIFALVPLDQKRFELKKLKIQAKAQMKAVQQRKKQGTP